MQLISGRPLHRAQAEMSLFEKVRVIQQVAEALHTAHKQGLIHRDIKPSNIMVERTPEGGFHPYVMDFGLARETSGDQSRSGIIEGTPRYMAPEQARGDTKHLDRRTDVYALGVTLYELLVGRAPYETQGDMDTLLAVIAAEPTPLRRVDGQIPADLEAVTLKCLEKEQSARYDSAKALAEDLGRYLDGEPVQARHIGLGQRLLRRARKHKPLVALAGALFLSLLGLVAYGTRVRIVAAERERAAEEQAKIAQSVGQQIGQMEWLLRSARQLPLHDLGREKQKVRERMKGLQRELGQRAGVTEGPLHYALGRGHLALHEYDAALSELEASLSRGHAGPEVHYALGLVLGKLYERGMYEVRLSGSGEWAEKQRRGLVPKYLEPAIESLQRSRAQKVDAPRYLEAQIKYYQGDYEGAWQEAEAAYGDAGWLYEALKLQGDIGYERALRARDSGKYEEAEKQFGSAVRKYEEASRIGASDSEVYEGLAEAWVRQIEMAMQRGQSPEEAYRRAKEASERASEAERERVGGKLKRGYAALMTMATLGSGQSTAERVKECMTATEGVLEAEPDNPYARDVAAGCYAFSADAAQARGEDPEPLYRKAIGLLEPAVKKHPHFLWGLNDLAGLYIAIGALLQARGQGAANDMLSMAIEYEKTAIAMDSTYTMAYANSLIARSKLLSGMSVDSAWKDILNESDRDYARCIEVNKEFPLCHANYILVYGRASERAELGGGEVSGLVERVERARAALGKAGDGMLDVCQYTALAQLSQARWEVKQKREATEALMRHEEAVKRCLGVSGKDAMCRTLWAQSEWVKAEGASEGEVWKRLKEAERKAREATESPEVYGESWWTLAETQRLEQEQAKSETEREALGRGLRESLKGCYRVNAGHGRCHGTAGLVALSAAKEAKEAGERRERAAEAVRELEAALRSDGLLQRVYGGALTEAQNLARSAAGGR